MELGAKITEKQPLVYLGSNFLLNLATSSLKKVQSTDWTFFYK
jgi:hypothetical protein